ncbi:MAG: hypothetical protein OHK0046_01700 [Anaerolineae bacterium]
MSNGVKVPVIGYNIHEYAYDMTEAQAPDVSANYGWFNIVLPEDNLQPENHRSGWVIATGVDGCDFLTEPISEFSGSTINNLGDALPEPLDLRDPNACINVINALARRDCAAQVYYVYYSAYEGTGAPTLLHLMAVMARIELGLTPNEESNTLVVGTLINNYRNSCIGGCSGTDLIEWLASKQGWYAEGKSNYSLVELESALFTFATVPTDIENALASVSLSTGYTTPSGQVPDDWGNWWYRHLPTTDDGYYRVLDENYETEDKPTSVYCERIIKTGLNWSDYVFAIVTAVQDSKLPGTNQKEPNQIPSWVTTRQTPSTTCPTQL